MNLDKSKHFLLSKINITAILMGLFSLSELADKLPPSLTRYAPVLTFVGAVALFIFRTFFTTKVLTSDGHALTYTAPGTDGDK